MGKHSNLGPIDPQVNGVPAYGVLAEFENACNEIKADPSKLAAWQPIIAQYRPTFLLRCKNAIQWSNAFVKAQLTAVMFGGDPDAEAKATGIVEALADRRADEPHDHHFHFDQCLDMGLNVKALESKEDSDEELQDLVLTIHHCYMHIFMNSGFFKAIENHNGVALLKMAKS